MFDRRVPTRPALAILGLIVLVSVLVQWVLVLTARSAPNTLDVIDRAAITVYEAAMQSGTPQSITFTESGELRLSTGETFDLPGQVDAVGFVGRGVEIFPPPFEVRLNGSGMLTGSVAALHIERQIVFLNRHGGGTIRTEVNDAD